MSTINVPVETLQNITRFVSSASPQLEKAASEFSKRASLAPQWVDRAISVGIVHPSHRDSLTESLVAGDTEKLALLIDKALDNVRVPSLGSVDNSITKPSDTKAESWARFEEAMRQ